MTQTKKQDRKIAKVMREFKKKKLSIGKSDKKVKNRKKRSLLLCEKQA
tara:strand:+ start:114 stop:257 length:144 start_codon:yes stop_codon:yes gene_type:complete